MLPILANAGLTLTTMFFVFICFLLIIVILVQKPAGGGLVGAFGGAGGVQDFLGAKMGSKITWFTVILFTLFVILSCVLTVAARPDYDKPTPAATTTAPADKAPQKTSEKAEKTSEKSEKPAVATTTAPTEKTP